MLKNDIDYKHKMSSLFNISTIWIFLVQLREFLPQIFECSTILTLGIDCVQFLHLLFWLQKRQYKLFPLCIFCVLSILLCIINMNILQMFNILIVCLLLKDTNIKEIILQLFVTNIFLLILYFFSLCMGDINDVIVAMPKGEVHTLGFYNSNVASLFFLKQILITSLFFIEYVKLPLLNIPLLILSYIIYKLTMGRTFFYAEILYFFMIYVFKIKFFRNHFRWAYLSIPFIFYLLTFASIFIGEKIPALNLFLTGRPFYYSKWLNNMSAINFLAGIQIVDDPLDSMYMMFLFSGGIFFVFVFLLFYINGIKNISDRDMKNYMPFIICMLVAGFTENTVNGINTLAIVFFCVLSKQFKLSNKRYKKIKKYI